MGEGGGAGVTAIPKISSGGLGGANVHLQNKHWGGGGWGQTSILKIIWGGGADVRIAFSTGGGGGGGAMSIYTFFHWGANVLGCKCP